MTDTDDIYEQATRPKQQEHEIADDIFYQAARASEWNAAYGPHHNPRTREQLAEDRDYHAAVNTERPTIELTPEDEQLYQQYKNPPSGKTELNTEDQELWNSIHNTNN